jgi:hypothetical protein
LTTDTRVEVGYMPKLAGRDRVYESSAGTVGGWTLFGLVGGIAARRVPGRGRKVGGHGPSVVAVEALRLSDLVRTVGGFPLDAQLVEILLERADRILAADGGRHCERVLTDAEIDLLLAGEEPGSAV